MNKETSNESVCEVAHGYCDVLEPCRCEEAKFEQGALLPLLTGVICFSFLYPPSFTWLIDNYDLLTVESGTGLLLFCYLYIIWFTKTSL